MVNYSKVIQRSMFAQLAIYALALIIATFVENAHGAALAKQWFYHSLWFIILQLMMVANFLLLAFKIQVFSKKQVGDVIFHFAFVIILIGAFITHVFGYEGIMHIRQGETSDFIVIPKTMEQKKVPFSIALNRFVVEKYPGSNSPSSYSSEVVLTVNGKAKNTEIQMNKFIDVGAYRVFQSSYDKDEQGTVLSVNYDQAGMLISYTGYFLLVVGMIVSLFNPASRIRVLTARLNRKNNVASKLLAIAILVATLSTISTSAKASNAVIPSISQEQAQAFGKLAVQNPKGRLEPAHVWTEKIVQKIYKKNRFEDYSPEQVFLNLFVYPYEWSEVKIVCVDNEQIMSKLGKSGKHISFHDVFDAQGEFILQEDINTAYRKATAERTRYDNDLIRVDEAVNIVYQIQQAKLLPIFPDENSATGHWYSAGDDLSAFSGKDSMFVAKVVRWYAEELLKNNNKQTNEILEMIEVFQINKSTIEIDIDKIDAQLWYNKANIFATSFKLYFAFGFLLLIVLCYSMFSTSKYMKHIVMACVMLLCAVFLYHTFGLGLRWYIAGYAPWTNSYESMVFLAWLTFFASLLFIQRYRIVVALGAITSGLLLAVASMSEMNPEITPLVPVLQSFWLMVHVAVIMIGYGYFFICAILGLFNLFLLSLGKWTKDNKVSQTLNDLTTVNEILMILGLFFMTVGTFLGAVWANESWGRYWGWDPKETWALISIIVYTLVFHWRLITNKENIYLFNLLSVLALISILMTYLGVNYYFGGMHSYGKMSGGLIPTPFIIGIAIVATLGYTAYRRQTKHN